MCDPEVLDAIEARGYIEAQREVLQNENLILKPDSVLEYSCMDGMYYQFAAFINFSEISWIGSLAQPGILYLDEALVTIISDALATYVLYNYPHQFLGGRSGDFYVPALPALFLDWQPATCDYMAEIWQTAKCMNFFDEDDHDAFFDFSWYAGDPTNPTSFGDPRTNVLALGWFWPNTCSTGLPSIYQWDIEAAFNVRSGSHVLWDENNWGDTTPYEDDPVNGPYLSLILPVGTPIPNNPNVSCAPPIETGVCVQVESSGSGPYMDAICPNPGCHYNVPAGGGNSCNDVFTCTP